MFPRKRSRTNGYPRRALLEANRAPGLCIDEESGVTPWDGVPMDESLAIEGVLTAGGEFEF